MSSSRTTNSSWRIRLPSCTNSSCPSIPRCPLPSPPRSPAPFSLSPTRSSPISQTKSSRWSWALDRSTSTPLRLLWDWGVEMTDRRAVRWSGCFCAMTAVCISRWFWTRRRRGSRARSRRSIERRETVDSMGRKWGTEWCRGEFRSEEDGVLTLVWDNTRSLITGKEIRVRLAVKRSRKRVDEW